MRRRGAQKKTKQDDCREETEEIKMERPRQERLVGERDRRSSSSTVLCVLPELYK